jgi:hypothetical protein
MPVDVRAPRPEGFSAAPAKRVGMRLAGVDISTELQLQSLHAGHVAACCSACERRLLPGELLHVYDSGRTLCTLCRASLAEPEAALLRSERIHATAVRLSVVPRAA